MHAEFIKQETPQRMERSGQHCYSVQQLHGSCGVAVAYTIVWLTTHFSGPCRRCYLGGIRRDSWDEKLHWFADSFRGDRKRFILHTLEGSQSKNGVANRDSMPFTRKNIDPCMPVCSHGAKSETDSPSDQLRSNPISNPKTVMSQPTGRRYKCQILRQH